MLERLVCQALAMRCCGGHRANTTLTLSLGDSYIIDHLARRLYQRTSRPSQIKRSGVLRACQHQSGLWCCLALIGEPNFPGAR